MFIIKPKKIDQITINYEGYQSRFKKDHHLPENYKVDFPNLIFTPIDEEIMKMLNMPSNIPKNPKYIEDIIMPQKTKNIISNLSKNFIFGIAAIELNLEKGGSAIIAFDKSTPYPEIIECYAINFELVKVHKNYVEFERFDKKINMLPYLRYYIDGGLIKPANIKVNKNFF